MGVKKPKYIQMNFIPHAIQRYPTAGDYAECEETGGWYVFLSETRDWRYSFLVGLHELVEMALTKHRGIDWNLIDEWDMIGPGKDSDDPGAMEDSPYYKEHMQAESIEWAVANMLDVAWADYQKALDEELK